VKALGVRLRQLAAGGHGRGEKKAQVSTLPVGGRNAMPVGGPLDMAVGKKAQVSTLPVGGRKVIPVGGRKVIPVGGRNAMPVGGPLDMAVGKKAQVSTLPVGGPQGQLAAAGAWGRNASWRDATQRQLAVGGPKISKSDWAQSAGFCTIRQAHLLWEIGKKVRARPFPTVKIYILIGIVQRNCFSANIPSTEAGGYV
jgi:hypothetical protein